MTQILVIDDDPFILELVQSILTRPDRTIMTTGSGAGGLARLAETPPDLVLLDLWLPDISGLEVLRFLHQAKGWQGVRILMLTASGDIDHMVQAKATGASGYICKPFQPQALAEMVDDILGQTNLVWMDDYTRLRQQD